jgi:hypothetical protein
MPAAFDMKLSFYGETAAAQFLHLQPPLNRASKSIGCLLTGSSLPLKESLPYNNKGVKNNGLHGKTACRNRRG